MQKNRLGDHEQGFPPISVKSWSRVWESLWCPCFELGRVRSALNDEDSGIRSCLLSALCCPIAVPWIAVRQRREIMHRYGIPGGTLEAAKGVCWPIALAQHRAFLNEVSKDGNWRFPWESGDAWSVQRPETPVFNVVVLGSAGAGVTSFVHAAVGAKKTDEEARGLERPRDFAVGARLVKTKGRIAVVNFWDVPAASDVEIPTDFLLEADAVILVFNADDISSLHYSLDLYDDIFAAETTTTNLWDYPSGSSSSPEEEEHDDYQGPAESQQNKTPPVRLLLGNVHRDRAVDDACEFTTDVDHAAAVRRMATCMLAVHAPSSQGTKLLVETLVEKIWNAREGS